MDSGSIAFYKHAGFVNAGTLVTDIGGGFVMDDYRMTLKPFARRPGFPDVQDFHCTDGMAVYSFGLSTARDPRAERPRGGRKDEDEYAHN